MVEAATLFAAPLAGMLLGDFGAEVIKIEHPAAARSGARPRPEQGRRRASGSRRSRATSASSRSTSRSRTGATLFLRLAARAPTSCSRTSGPGRSSAGALGWDELSAVNPRLVLARVSGFGQTGPYARRPGFGTLAEAMSGFAALNGEPDGPPLLPPLALADGVAALATAFAVMVALRAREATGGGQVVDTSLVEPLLTLLGPQLTACDLLGELQPRTGNRSSHNAPRNVYRTADGSWVAVSASADSIAERVLRLVGRRRPRRAAVVRDRRRAGRARRRDRRGGGRVDRRRARATRCSQRSRRRRPRSRRSTTRATSSPTRSSPRSGRSPPWTTTSSAVRMTNVISRLSETPGEIRRAGGRARRRHRGGARRARRRRRDELERLCARGASLSVPPLTWLYVPADRPDRVEKAIASRAHAVIVDLEDGVAPPAKDEARANLAELLGAPRGKPVYVRVNAGRRTPTSRRSRRCRLAGDRRPEGRAPGRDVPDARPPPGQLPDRVGRRARGGVRIASAPGVAGISLGEADLRSQTGALEAGLDWARGRIVNAAVAAGLPRPPQSVYPHVRDLEGLARSCARGRELGHLGRAAIHPAQLRDDRAGVPADGRRGRAGARDGRAARGSGVGTLEGGDVRRRCDARRGAADRRDRRARTAPRHIHHQGGTHDDRLTPALAGIAALLLVWCALGRRLEQRRR